MLTDNGHPNTIDPLKIRKPCCQVISWSHIAILTKLLKFWGTRALLIWFTEYLYTDTRRLNSCFRKPRTYIYWHKRTECIVAFANRSLSGLESRYRQTEKEALGIMWAYDHYDKYLRGATHVWITDYKPLLTIKQWPKPPLSFDLWDSDSTVEAIII